MIESIGIIGGGQMAEALIRGFLERDLFRPQRIFVSEPLRERRQYLEEYYSIRTTEKNSDVIESESTIILAVKPQVMDEVLKEISEKVIPQRHLLISIAAGLPISYYEKRLPPRTKIIRVMPNTCALVHKSISAITPGSFAEERDLKIGTYLFGAIGKVFVIEEKYLDAVTALSGSGPAYVALFIEALIESGVRCGLPRNIAEKLVLATLEGTVTLIEKTSKNPYEIRAMVTSPGGTTINALNVLYRDGFSGIIIDAVYSAFRRALELRAELE